MKGNITHQIMQGCIIIAMSFYPRISSGQDLPKIFPPAPNTASLGKYMETPVSLATGIPEIKVPLYTINEGSITVPISLSYHAGGIKVEEVASWVGLGWNLNAGGVISRTVRGLPDDYGTKGFMVTSETVEDMNQYKSTNYALFQSKAYDAAVANLLDFEPDIFHFSFAGYSGRFFYDQLTDQFIQTPYSNIKIEHFFGSNGSGGNEIVRWEVTTSDGTIYYFGKSKDGLRSGTDENASITNFSHTTNGGTGDTDSSNPDHKNAWHLMDIVSPAGDVVSFTYTQQQSVSQITKSGESLLWPSCDADSYTASFSESLTDQTILDKIEFSNGRVEFIEDVSDRLDLPGSKALKTVEIYQNNSLLKQFNLNQDYTLSSVDNTWSTVGTSNMVLSRRYRLMLNSVEEESNLGNTLPPHSFEYNSKKLPSRFSNAQDYWGYYNGETGNSNLIPETIVQTNPDIYLGTADRTVDTLDSKAAMLTKITYPTGGYAKYVYESNTAAPSSLYSESVIDIGNQTVPNILYFLKIPANIDPANPSDYISQSFTINNLVGNVSFNVIITNCDIDNDPDSCDYLFHIIGVTNPSYNLQISSSTLNISLAPGEYKLITTAGASASASTDFSVVVNWSEDSQTEYINVGGQRVQKIFLNDGNGNTITKSYDYNYLDQSLTSGYVVSTPVFLNSEFYNGSCSPPSAAIADKITSYSQAPMVSVNGSVTAYRNVTEYINDDIKTEYTFSHYGNYVLSGSVSGEINLPDVYFDWYRGNLILKEEFKLENGIYDRVTRLFNVYEDAMEYQIQNSGLKIMPEIQLSEVLNMKFDYGFYGNMSEYYRLAKTIKTDYFDGNEVISEQDFIYDNNPLLASETKSTSSDEKPIITKTFYPDDVTNTTSLGNDALSSVEKAAIDKLKTTDLHQLTPVQVDTYKDLDDDGIAETNELLNRQRTIYKEWYTDIVLPEYIQTSKDDTSFDDRIQFHDYYDNGNVKEVSKQDGTPIVYIWGYNEQYPIAKIENATYSEVSSQVTNLQNLSNADDSVADENTLRSALTTLRNTSSLSDAMVTTYTYDPLIGVTSTTDPRGYTIYYEYDEFNRLEFVKDADGNLVSENKYNYKN